VNGAFFLVRYPQINACWAWYSCHAYILRNGRCLFQYIVQTLPDITQNHYG
jgi:hypothetical protein